MSSLTKETELSNDKKAVIFVLEELGEASTSEIIAEAAKLSHRCKDRVPSILIALEKDNKVVKKISKEKKAIVWELIHEN